LGSGRGRAFQKDRKDRGGILRGVQEAETNTSTPKDNMPLEREGGQGSKKTRVGGEFAPGTKEGRQAGHAWEEKKEGSSAVKTKKKGEEREYPRHRGNAKQKKVGRGEYTKQAKGEVIKTGDWGGAQ